NWDGRDNSGSPVPGGMYTITMQSSDKVQSRRIVITN
ncbi:MAG: flagellar biosynthesis protein FlgD, partial [Bacteroidetes bacterium]